MVDVKELMYLIGLHGIKEINESIVNSYGNSHYGNISDGSSVVTSGIKLSTYTGFSDHYIKTGFVTDSGVESSKENKIHADLAAVFEGGRFIELVTLDGVYDHKITNTMNKVLIKLSETYRIIDISHVLNGGSPIATTTFTLKVR